MTDRNALQRSLETQLQQLLARAADIENVLSDPGEADWQENALASEDDEALAQVGNITRQQIQDTRLALHRLENGTWSRCANCGNPIEPERLELLPTTCHCSRCA